jgi:hypothetical protein
MLPIVKFTEPDAVALPTRLSGGQTMNHWFDGLPEIYEDVPDVGGPGIGAFGMIIENTILRRMDMSLPRLTVSGGGRNGWDNSSMRDR